MQGRFIFHAKIPRSRSHACRVEIILPKRKTEVKYHISRLRCRGARWNVDVAHRYKHSDIIVAKRTQTVKVKSVIRLLNSSS